VAGSRPDRHQQSGWRFGLERVRKVSGTTGLDGVSFHMGLVTVTRLGALVFVLLACTGDSLPESITPDSGASESFDAGSRVTVEYNDEGAVCLSPRPDGTHVQVVLDACASFCARTEARCSVEVTDSVIQLTARGRAVLETADLDCPDACLPVEARCELPTLSEGSHTLRYGSRSASIVLPVEEARTQILPGNETSACNVVPVLE
jgi:hypothetical protein